jgi:hypothetical protein
LAGSSEISESDVSLDVNISQPDISLNSYVGGIAGSNSGTIRQSSYSGTFYLSFAGVSPFANTGGIAGENTGTIETCYAAPVITINTDTTSGQHYLYTGGLAGANTGTLRNSYAACEIGITVTTTSAGTKNIYSGGVAGSRGQSASSGGAIEKCYAAGSLQISINGTINSYDLIRSSGISNDADSVSLSAALLSAITSKAGASSAGTYSRIAPMGTLTGNIAFNNMLVNDAALSDAVTDPQDDANGLGKTATELASQSTYAGLGWDFTGVWEMGPAEYPYPVLQRQTGMPPADFALPED